MSENKDLHDSPTDLDHIEVGTSINWLTKDKKIVEGIVLERVRARRRPTVHFFENECSRRIASYIVESMIESRNKSGRFIRRYFWINTSQIVEEDVATVGISPRVVPTPYLIDFSALLKHLPAGY